MNIKLKEKRILMGKDEMKKTIDRLCSEIVEGNQKMESLWQSTFD